MGDRVAVMRKGELQQVAPPQELYDRPVNLFVGGFIGSPAMNVLEAKLEREDGGLVAVAGSQRIMLGAGDPERPPRARSSTRDAPIVLGIRPEDLDDAVARRGPGGSAADAARSTLTEALGSEVMVHFRVDASPAQTEEVRELAKDAGAEGLTELNQDGGATMVGRFGARSRVKSGDERRGRRRHPRTALFRARERAWDL